MGRPKKIQEQDKVQTEKTSTSTKRVKSVQNKAVTKKVLPKNVSESLKKRRYKSNALKSSMLEALEKTLGVVTPAAKIANLTRKTHYEWLKDDDDYRAAVESIEDLAVDFAETKLHKEISDGNATAIIFYLKTKGRKRGYIERQEVSSTNINFNHEEQITPEEIKKKRDELYKDI